MGFDSPIAQTEDLYIKSINATVDNYVAMLETVRRDALVLPNRDLDDGKDTSASEYSLADEAYATLLAELLERGFEGTSPELRDNIMAFYSDLSLPIGTKKTPALWQGVLTGLEQLKGVTKTSIVGNQLPDEAIVPVPNRTK